MPKIDAVKSKNCAITMQTPAAMSWSSLMYREVKAKAVAVAKLLTAVALSIVLLH